MNAQSFSSRTRRASTLIALCFAMLALPVSLFSQNGKNNAKVWQLSGMVLDRSTGHPIPYVKVKINGGARFGVCNAEGFYSLPVVATDTLHFSCVGYKGSKLFFGEYIKGYQGDTSSSYVYEIHYLLQDTITLPTVVIYPYRNATDIKMAIINQSAPFEMEIANLQTNVSPELMSYMMSNLPNDEAERMQVARMRHEAMMSQRGVRPTVNLVDPVAVFNLIDYMNRQSKAKKDKIIRSFDE